MIPNPRNRGESETSSRFTQDRDEELENVRSSTSVQGLEDDEEDIDDSEDVESAVADLDQEEDDDSLDIEKDDDEDDMPLQDQSRGGYR